MITSLGTQGGRKYGQFGSTATGSIARLPGFGTTATVAPVAASPSGGFADLGTLGERKRKHKYPEAIEEILDAVAANQVESLEIDAQQQKRSIQRAMRLRGVRYETKYLEDLAERREALIVQELAKHQQIIAAHNMNAAQAIQFMLDLDEQATVDALMAALEYLTRH